MYKYIYINCYYSVIPFRLLQHTVCCKVEVSITQKNFIALYACKGFFFCIFILPDDAFS